MKQGQLFESLLLLLCNLSCISCLSYISTIHQHHLLVLEFMIFHTYVSWITQQTLSCVAANIRIICLVGY